MNKPMNILGIAGSLRRQSYNRAALRAAKQLAPEGAQDAATTNATKPYKRGLGWYRIEFDAPKDGAQHWLEFGAASMVAYVWLNGQKLGEHKGGFTRFRFDVTVGLKKGRNALLVKVDNSTPTNDYSRTAIIPLAGDCNYSGGLYRYVSLVTTGDPVHFDLGDLGGPGIYATTTAIDGGNATVHVRAKMMNDSKQDADLTVRAALLDAEGRVAQSMETNVFLTPGDKIEVAQVLNVKQARLWQGVEDPYQYRLVAELLRPGGEAIDRIVQNFGIRRMRFDPNQGFFLNDKHVRLHGVAMHQDFLGKGWAISNHDLDSSFALIKEIGANTVRLGHYPFSQYALETVNRLGLVAWAEVPFGLGVTVEPPLALGTAKLRCPTRDATEALRANARQQLRELIASNTTTRPSPCGPLATRPLFCRKTAQQRRMTTSLRCCESCRRSPEAKTPAGSRLWRISPRISRLRFRANTSP
jgi:beta-galactosidase